MHFDHIAEARQEKNFAIWLKAFLSKSPENLAMQLAQRHISRKPKAACRWKNGAFNICYRVRYDDGPEVIVRFAALGRVIFRKEKTRNEVAVMKYVRRNTSIPVPEVFGWGSCWAGPYIVMAFIEGEPLSMLLKDPLQKGRPILNPQISDRVLKMAFREMAKLLLELSTIELPRIGSLQENGDDIVVASRPMTFNFNELATAANLPPGEFPARSFESATEYFQALADMHLSQLRDQQNDAVTDVADCRKKYIARCLFRKIVKDIYKEHDNGPFILSCDDFRPSNVLIDLNTLRIAAVIDWEFSYAAPVEFTHVAPWWLLLQSPEDWECGLNEFLKRYTPRFRLFVEALRECEAEHLQWNTRPLSERLSARMEQSLDNGLFWVCLASRYSSMLDEIYWTFLDERYHGPFTCIEDRVRLLTEEEQRDMHGLVRRKMQQNGEQTLHDHYPGSKLVDL